MIEETYPWTEEHPFRTIKTTECNGGIMDDFTRKRAYLRNSNGIIDEQSKYWTLVKVLKSTTNVVHWLIKMHHQYFVVSQSKLYQLDEVVSIFEADRRGRYDNLNPCVIYKSYIDMESAMDAFAQEYMAMLINQRHQDVSFMFEQQ